MPAELLHRTTSPDEASLLRLLIDSVQDYAILTLDAEGRVTQWNAGAERIKGWTAEEILGQPYARFFPPEDVAQGVPEGVLATAAREGRFQGEGWRVRKDGTRFWASVVVTALRDPQGRLLGYGKVTRDFTERRAAEERLRASEERYRALVASVRDYAIFMLDPEGYVLTWNAGAQALEGYAPREIVGQHFSRFYPPEDLRAGRPQRELDVAAREGRTEEEGWRVRKDGTRFWANVVVTALRAPSGELRGFTQVMRDVTARREAEDRLRASEERFRMLVGSVKDYAIFMLDPRGRVVTWNDGAERLKGYAAEEIIGEHFSRFYPPEAAETGHPQMELDVATREGRYEEEGWRVRKDGTRFWANVVLTALRDADGHLVGFAKVTRDFTERKNAQERLRQSEERFRALVGSVKDYAIFMLDPHGYVVTWNDGAERIKGYPADEIIGQHFSRFYPPEDLAAGKPRLELEVAAREGRYEEEGWRVRKDGTRFWANAVLTALRNPDGTLRGFAKVTRDFTARREEEERREVERLRDAVKSRDEFLSVASHELRTPLTPLQLKLGAMLRAATSAGAGGVPGEKLVRDLETSRRQVERLSALIEDMLDISRLATGGLKLAPAPVDLAALVRDVAGRYAPQAERAGCALEVDAAAPVVGAWDARRVDQVVTNLLTNALKYGAGAPVHLSVTREGGEAVLRVRDGGIGIPVEEQPRIFERFVRASPVSHFGGLGLGLFITRQVVEAHGGTVGVESVPGQGATFTVRLPVE